MASNDAQNVESHGRDRMDHEFEAEDESENEELEGWDDWEVENDDVEEGDSSESDFLCFFCDSRYGSCDALFEHCTSSHHFDFRGIRGELGLDFYGTFKLINYVRSQVAENRCWSCGVICQSNEDLQNHLHGTVNIEAIKPCWDHERYLKPFVEDDSLLYNIGEDEEGEDDDSAPVDKEEVMSNLKNYEVISIDDCNSGENIVFDADNCDINRSKVLSASSDCSNITSSLENTMVNGVDAIELTGSYYRKSERYAYQTYCCYPGFKGYKECK